MSSNYSNLPTRYLRAQKKSVIGSALSLSSQTLFLPISLATRLFSPLMNSFGLRRFYFNRYSGIWDLVSIAGKIFAAYLGTILIFNPDSYSHIPSELRTPLNSAAIFFAASALLASIFGLFRGLVAAGFWGFMIFTLYQGVNSATVGSAVPAKEKVSVASKSITTGLEYADIPELHSFNLNNVNFNPANFRVVRRTAQYSPTTSAMSLSSINLDAYNPQHLVDQAYLKTQEGISAGLASVTDSLEGMVSKPVQEALRALNLDSTGFGQNILSTLGGNSGPFPDSAYFGKPIGKVNFYPIGGGGSRSDKLSSFMKKFGIAQ